MSKSGQCYCNRSVSNTAEESGNALCLDEFDEKLEIIERSRKGETATGTAQTYGVVGRTTANDIKRDADKIDKISVNRHRARSRR